LDPAAEFRIQVRASARGGQGAFMLASLLAAAALPAAAEDFAILFGRGPGETRIIQFDDSDGNETWFMTRCQNAFSPDYYVLIREFGEAEQIKPVNSPLEAEKTVCVIGHIPDMVKRYMR
jgi:hypothetical protein